MCMGSRDALRMCGNVLQVWPGAGLAGGGGGCRDMWGLAWEDPDQFPGSISFPSPPLSSGANTGSHTRWCMESVAVMWRCHACRPDLIVTMCWWRCLGCRGSGVGWEVVAGADPEPEPGEASECIGAWLGPTLLWRSELVNIISRAPALASHVGLIISVMCVPRIDILFGASESIIGNRLAKSPTPVPGPSLSFSIQTIRSQVWVLLSWGSFGEAIMDVNNRPIVDSEHKILLTPSG